MSDSGGHRSLDAAEIDDLVRRAMEAWSAPGASLAIVEGDEILYLKGYGVREIGREEPVTPDTLFAIGSTTKAFVTAAMAMLVDDGKMSWDDPVRKHVPFFRLHDPLADANVTLRDLVCHRTGMSRHDPLWYGSPWTREEIIRKIGLLPPASSFRSRWEYQNIMFLTAGYAVGSASESTWEEFTQRRIFEPLGMTGANFSTTRAEVAPDHATPHHRVDETVRPIPWRNLDNVAPAGSINAGVRDLAHWIRLHLGSGVFDGKKLVSRENLVETHSPHMTLKLDDDTRTLHPNRTQTSYGLGWGIEDHHGRLIVAHGGGIDGMRAQVALLPRENLGIAVLSNVTPSALPEAVLYGVIDSLLDLPRKDWVEAIRALGKKQEDLGAKQHEEWKARRRADTHPSRELEAYAGEYEHPAYGLVQVGLEAGALHLRWNRSEAALSHWHHDTFVGPEKLPLSILENARVLFRLGEEGAVESLKAFDVEFTRVKPVESPVRAPAAEESLEAAETQDLEPAPAQGELPGDTRGRR